jgi:ERCC4-related helicase
MNKEFLHMQKLAGIITEGEYKEKLQTVREEEGVDDVDDPKLDKIEDKVKSELDKNEDLKN